MVTATIYTSGSRRCPWRHVIQRHLAVTSRHTAPPSAHLIQRHLAVMSRHTASPDGDVSIRNHSDQCPFGNHLPPSPPPSPLLFFERAYPSKYQKKFNQKFNQSERSKLHNSQNRKFVGAAITVTKNTPLNGFLSAASFHLRRLPFISKTSFLGSIFTLHIYHFSTSNAK